MSFMKKIGDVFNKAVEKTGEATTYASEKASMVTAQTKFKMEQQKLRGKIPNLYKELGEKVYIAMRDDLGHDVLTETVTDYTEQLNLINAEIVELDKKIEDVAQEFEEKMAEAAEAREQAAAEKAAAEQAAAEQAAAEQAAANAAAAKATAEQAAINATAEQVLANQTVEEVGTTTSGVVEEVKSTTSGVVEEVKSVGSGVVEEVNATTSGVVEEVNATASGVVEEVKATTSGVVEEIGGDVEEKFAEAAKFDDKTFID